MLLADTLDLGLVVAKLGTSSITYRVGIFLQQDSEGSVKRDSRACAVVDFVHVYVDPKTRKTIPMPKVAREGLLPIYRPDHENGKL
jgi:acyl-CoA thioester hydrolase